MSFTQAMGLPDQPNYKLKDLLDIHARATWVEVIKQKKIIAIRVGNAWRIPKEALESYLKSRSNMATED